MIEIEKNVPNAPCGFQAYQTHVGIHPNPELGETPFSFFSSKPMPAERIDPVQFVSGSRAKAVKVANKAVKTGRAYDPNIENAWNEFMNEFPRTDDVCMNIFR